MNQDEVRDQLLSLLVMDLGYTQDDPPTYGHSPLRHQYAWKFATECLSAAELTDEVGRRLKQMEDEKDIR